MLRLLLKEGLLLARYLSRRSRLQIWETRGLCPKYYDRAEPWSHSRRRSKLCRWLDLDILVSEYRRRIMLA